MRTVFVRLIALGALSVVVGCSGNSNTPLPVTGGNNGVGGAPGLTTGQATGGATVSTAAVTSPAFTATGSVSGIAAVLGDLVTVSFPSTVTIPAATTFTLTTQVTSVAGGPASATPLIFGKITFSGPVTGTTTPAITLTAPNGLPPGKTTYTLSVNAVGATTSTTVTSAGTVTGNTVTFPAATIAYPASATALNFAITVS